MKFQTTKETLFNGIQIVHNIVGSKVNLPILSNMLLEAGNGKLKMVTTDLDVGISCEYPVEIVENGSITVHTKRFSDIIHELPDGNVTLSVKKNNMVTIQTENCEFKISGLPKDEFPKLPEFKDKEAIKIRQPLLKEMFIKTSFAASKDETRYVLNGILFEVENNKISLIATDGRRLAIIEKNINTGINRQISMIVPIKTINELNRNLKDEGDVLIVLGENQVLFDLGPVHIISRLIEGQFPSYKQVVPQEQKDKIKLNREELSSEYSGKELIVGFNPAYLIDVLKNLQEIVVNFEVTDPEKPGVLRADGYLYVVLPMRL